MRKHSTVNLGLVADLETVLPPHVAFTGLIVAVSTWAIMKPDPIFPQLDDPTGRPEDWTVGEMRRWLNLVRYAINSSRPDRN